MYRLTFGRTPTAEEISSAIEFVEGQGGDSPEDDGSRLSRWEQLAQVLVLTNEFLFVD
jgi:hypothetical protein